MKPFTLLPRTHPHHHCSPITGPNPWRDGPPRYLSPSFLPTPSSKPALPNLASCIALPPQCAHTCTPAHFSSSTSKAIPYPKIMHSQLYSSLPSRKPLDFLYVFLHLPSFGPFYSPISRAMGLGPVALDQLNSQAFAEGCPACTCGSGLSASSSHPPRAVGLCSSHGSPSLSWGRVCDSLILL